MEDANSTQPDSEAYLRRSASTASTKLTENVGPSRSGTLRKRQSLRKRDSLRRSGSKKSLRAGSIKGVGFDEDEFESIFHTPIPTTGNPTEVLANRFHAWRKLLKDLITYFREIQSSYEQRSRSLLKVSNVLNNTTAPPNFLSEGGLEDAARSLRAFHKLSVAESNKSKDIENDVITQLSGLRSDLNQKIKEIKSLSGDFKNSVEKEKDTTRKAITALHDAIAVAESDPAAASGKNDPFIVRLSVERQVEKQIEEENYLHRAYLNLEGSGRELESIVVGEIQKAYNALASILKREADSSGRTIDELRSGPISMPKDHEWEAFVKQETHFVNPELPLRRVEDIHYPGKFSTSAAEIRAGMLERKSKYLKSYTPGWYVLSPTHLHEFKSADHIYTQQPVMSLCLLDQKLGSRSQADASSHKFSLKGRQTGGLHRGHSWVFRAESFDTMKAWYDDIMNLTEKTGEEKTAFVRRHTRSVSGGNRSAPSVSSDGIDDDEADSKPYAAGAYSQPAENKESVQRRPEPGGRFPSDMKIDHAKDSQAPSSPTSDSSNGRKELADPQPVTTVGQGTKATEDVTPLKQEAVTQINEPKAIEPVAAITTVEATDGAAETEAPPRAEMPAYAETPAHTEVSALDAGADKGKAPAVPEVAIQDAPPAASQVSTTTVITGQDSSDNSHLHSTGRMFPVLRHDTDVTISEYHVPGEWATAKGASGQ